MLKRFISALHLLSFVCSKKKEAKKKGTTKTNRERDFAAQTCPASPSLSRFAVLLDHSAPLIINMLLLFTALLFQKQNPEIEQKIFNSRLYKILSTILNILIEEASELTGELKKVPLTFRQAEHTTTGVWGTR